MTKLHLWIKKNQLFTYLLAIVVVSVITVCLITVMVVLTRSKNTYVEANLQANTILLDKIQDDYETLNENMNRIFETVDNSQVVEHFLKESDNRSQTIVDLKKEMSMTRSVFEDTPSNLILLGKNGQTFFQNDGVRNQSIEDFLAGPLIQKVDEESAVSQYFYLDSGLTTSTFEKPGLLFIRKLSDTQSVFGYALIFISEAHFSSIYQDLLDANLHQLFILDANNNVISSNQKQQLGTHFDVPNSSEKAAQNVNQKPLYSYNFMLYDIFNESKLIQNMNLIQPTILITVLGILLVTISAFFVIRKTTQPIYHLIDALPAVTQGDFSHTVKLEGTFETRELGRAYNLMLQDLQSYFDHLIRTESEKRLIEIQSLQMQIQPHFIYNTLTAIKFLIWQNDQEKASTALENFIQLLRHTLSNKEEMAPLKDELAIVNSYINILQLRYGEGIQTNIFSDEESENIPVPKMILQPIIENVYLHAFPNGQEGFVHIFSRVSNQQLKIEIIDNGIGFEPRLHKPQNHDLKQHYSGIGLKNINERLQLLYGYKFGLHVHSELGKGTTITLLLPAP